ncbi:hypothetical protein CSKR_104357 [Clonorchis sinensis]|uniref:Uncharacterized protein n=1 Tax=Clonorchis sinensis TaxID=79923 RepID=A0A419QDS8_CLOSI|nr:hypothetical protein CSKR_104357 [Clonorchis sinensis]
MTSVFNTDASLPYNHDLFESLIVKKKNKDGQGGDLLLRSYNHSETIWIETNNKIATDIGWQPYLATSSTRPSGDHAVHILEDKSRIGHLSTSATLKWAWKTALSSAKDGWAYATHVPTNAASGAGHILQWKYMFIFCAFVFEKTDVCFVRTGTTSQSESAYWEWTWITKMVVRGSMYSATRVN